MGQKTIPQPKIVGAGLESGKKRGTVFGTTWEKTAQQKKDDAAAIEAFLASGGKVKQLRDGGEDYDKKKEQAEKRMPGSFNPFTKEDALTLEDEEHPER